MGDGHKMKCKLIITTAKEGENGRHRAQLWEGEIELKDKTEYLAMVTLLAEGQEHPICQIPFAMGIGHWHWIPDAPEEWDYGETEQ